MPANFPEMWEDRVRTNLDSSTNAPFMDGIAELNTEAIEVGSGTATESNIIHIPVSTIEPGVLVNNTTYPLNVVVYDDDTMDLKLDKFQTEVMSLSDDQVLGASYDVIDTATGSSTRAITKKKVGKAIHAMGPASNTTATPVLATTGELVGGRRRCTYEDIVALGAAMDAGGAPEENRRLVLCSEHRSDLLLDRKNFGDQLVNYRTGQPAPEIAGFQIYSYIKNPFYTAAGAKVPFASVPGGTDKRASIAFIGDAEHVAKKTGFTKQYFADSKSAPRTQISELSYRHYFLFMPIQNRCIAALTSAAS